jgi:Flp pilus assembly protein TadD
MTLGLMAALLLMAAVSSAQDGTATSGISTEEERVRWSVEQTGISKKDLVLRGNLLLAGNDLAKALMAFDKALELDAEDTAAQTGRAIVLARQGKFDEAEQLLRQQLPLTPDPARVYLELGRIHELRGDHAKALSVFREGIRVHEQGRR